MTGTSDWWKRRPLGRSGILVSRLATTCASLDVALRRLRLDHADVLLLRWWNQPPPPRILERALELKASGKARSVMISCHHRPTFAALIADP